MLALPAEPRRFRVGLFHHRGCVDEDLHLRAAFLRKPPRNLLQALLDEIVVVAVLRIDGNRRAAAPLQRFQRIAVGAVVHRQHDDRFRVRPERQRIGAPCRRLFHPAHLSVTAERKPVPQSFGKVGACIRPRDADIVEARLLRAGEEAAAQRVRVFRLRSRDWHRVSAAACRPRDRREARGSPAAT